MEGYSILTTFVGSHDPYNPDGSSGPIVSYLQVKRFQKIYLFYNNVDYLRRVRELARVAQKHAPYVKIEYIGIEVERPTDYEDLFREMSKNLHLIEEEDKNLTPHYFILTDSGTPQMQTCWFLIVFSGLFDAELIQGIPPQFAGGKYKARTVKLKSKDFPVILKPPCVELLSEGPSQADENLQTEGKISSRYWASLIGSDNKFVTVKGEAVRVAKYDISVLLYGETGSGKELFARLIHHSSPRSRGPFVAVNCSAISVQIAESELFGHKKGAFTGAVSDREGYFTVADGGTIFLDEIGDLPLELQPKLLRVLESGTYTPVGENKELTTDVRFITATNKNLEELSEKGEFRLDLLTRLKEYVLVIPPLRDRRQDIPLLVKYFVEEWNSKYSENKHISEDMYPYLVSYPWPGNIRELKNTVMSMCASSDPEGDILLKNLPQSIREYFQKRGEIPVQVNIPPEGLDLKNTLFTCEKEYYTKALEQTKGNKAEAARLLGIEPAAFRKALRERFGGV